MTRSPQYTWREQHCPVCGPAPARRLGRRGGDAHRSGLGSSCRVFQCRRCSLIYPNPMPVPEQIEEHYDDPVDYFKEHCIEGKLEDYDRVLTSLEAILKRTGRLLDVGAGRGEGLQAAQRRGWDAVGLEPSPAFAEAARRLSGSEVVEASIEQRPFPEGSFDAVTLGAVLEHVFNPLEVLTEIHRVLRPGGAFWLDVPNEAGAFYLLGNAYYRMRGRDWVVNLSPTFPPYHVFGYTPRSLRRLLEKAGFRVARLETYATPAVLDTTESPVPRTYRRPAKWLLTAGARMGAGTYMDAWSVKP